MRGRTISAISDAELTDAFGSDAHSPEEFDNLLFCEEFADRLGLEEADLATFGAGRS